MTGIRRKCPYCGYKQFIYIQIIAENDTIKIEEPYKICDACMELFKVELKFSIKTCKTEDSNVK